MSFYGARSGDGLESLSKERCSQLLNTHLIQANATHERFLISPFPVSPPTLGKWWTSSVHRLVYHSCTLTILVNVSGKLEEASKIVSISSV